MQQDSLMSTAGQCVIILREHGVELRLGLVDEDDAAYEVEAASDLEFSNEDSADEESRTK